MIHEDPLPPERDIIVVYSLPKCASTALVSSIRFYSSSQFYVFHTHHDTIFDIHWKFGNLTMEDILQQQRRIIVIDIYRNPIERKISEFFHELRTLHFPTTLPPLSQIIQRFHDIYYSFSDEDIFVDRFPQFFDPSFEFDHDKKYTISQHHHITFLKLRMADITEWPRILTKLLDIPIHRILRDNETKHEYLCAFKDEYRMPYFVWNDLSSDSSVISKHMQRYMTLSERQEYLQKWHQRLIPHGFEQPRSPWSLQQVEWYHAFCRENQIHFHPKCNHYKDDGCLCIACRILRVRCRQQIDDVAIKVIHNGHHEPVNVIRLTLIRNQQNIPILITMDKFFQLQVFEISESN